MGYDELAEELDRRDDLEERAERDLTARDRRDEKTPRCAHLGCTFPAPLGPYCGKHTGAELRDKRAGTEVRP